MALVDPAGSSAGLVTSPLANLTAGWQNSRTICSAFYGSWGMPTDCRNAINALPTGSSAVPFTVHGGPAGLNLPLSRISGNCQIQIEMAGPRVPRTVRLVPDDLRSMTSKLIDGCALESGHLGGFITGDLHGMIQWITSPEGYLDRPMPLYTSFPTISISTPHPEYYSPGNYDLLMAYYFAQAEQEAARKLPPGSRSARSLLERESRLRRQQKEMNPRGRRIPWWGNPGSPPRVSDPMAAGNATADALQGQASVGITLPGSSAGGSTGNDGTQTARKVRKRRI